MNLPVRHAAGESSPQLFWVNDGEREAGKPREKATRFRRIGTIKAATRKL